MREASVVVTSLTVDGLRNLASQTIDLAPRFNVVAGANGQGKTNLLEAIYLLATTRSFRTSRIVECVAHGRRSATIAARIDDARERIARGQRLTIDEGRRAAAIDGKRVASFAKFAIATPVVHFDPSSLALSQGSAAERRKLLDRIAFHAGAKGGGTERWIDDLDRYRRAHHARRVALERGGDVRTIEAYERLMADHGAAIVRGRGAAARALAERVRVAFARIVEDEHTIDVSYATRGSEDADRLAVMLAERRADDRRRKTATVGPHLDDLAISIDGRPARAVASQGQHRAIVLALKESELETIADARGALPVLLLDDVSSELDPKRNAALFRALLRRGGQAIVTTTRPALIEIDVDRRDFTVAAGLVTPLPNRP